MHSEHLTNLHPGWVVGGWFVAVAVASASFMVLVGIGLVPAETADALPFVAFAVALGFFTGGLVVGLRWSDAPIIHGAAITFLSVVVWFVTAVLAPGPTGRSIDAVFVLGMVLLQLVAAVGGAWMGRRMVLRGQTPPLDL